jgi:hypothetical protein
LEQFGAILSHLKPDWKTFFFPFFPLLDIFLKLFGTFWHFLFSPLTYSSLKKMFGTFLAPFWHFF